MKRRKWMRLLALAGTATLALSLAPASAAGKGKPAKAEVAVVMGYQGAGIATTCEEASLLMSGDASGFLRADWPANTKVEMSFPIGWSRNHPDGGDSGEAFSGCHGQPVAGSGDGFGGYFILSKGTDGSLDLTSRFDYYWEHEERQRGKKTIEVQTVLELFEINANLVRTDGLHFDFLSGEPQTVTGQLELLRFEKSSTEEGWTSQGTAWVTMTITLGG